MAKNQEIKLENAIYSIVENYRDCLNREELGNLFTDYFYPYDYIFGDYSYGKLRLKGFYDDNSKNSNSINSIKTYKKYLEDYCAYNCPYFLLKKEINVEKKA